MSATATFREPPPDKFGSGLTGAILLHAAVAAALVGAAIVHPFNKDRWGENASSEGAIQASIVAAIPLPTKAQPVEKSVLVQPDVTPVPAAPPKEATVTPPKPTDIAVKSKTTPAKTAPVETPAPPKHAQPAPVTPKAASGSTATQLPQSVMQTHNGTAALTVQDRVFGQQYAYYIEAVQRKVTQYWDRQQIDPSVPQGKTVKILFDIQRDGTLANIYVETSSGNNSLDTAALHTLQRIDGFGPLPAGDHHTIEDVFTYHQP